MNKTKIEWVRNPDGTQGYTWNPITGCLNHTPEGLCLGGMFPCYAYKLANGRLKPLYLANTHVGLEPMTGKWAQAINDPFYPRFWEDRLGLPIEHPTPMRPAKRKGIFVCDMSDLFGIGIPESWAEQVMTTIKLCPYHRFYLLTKQPQNLIKFSPFPKNCWVGVSVTNPNQLAYAINGLALVEAKVKYYSFEPLLERMVGHTEPLHPNHLADIQWVIIGTQTKPYKPPKIEWVEEIVRACDKAGIPVFLKENLNPMFAENDCKLFEEHRDTLFTFKDFESDGKTRWHLRQEMPE